jgi:hypothetical protein
MSGRTRAFHVKLLDWFAAMRHSLDGLSEADRRELWQWESENIGPTKDLALSDWPGWRKYIGDRPTCSYPIRAIIFRRIKKTDGRVTHLYTSLQ